MFAGLSELEGLVHGLFTPTSQYTYCGEFHYRGFIEGDAVVTCLACWAMYFERPYTYDDL